jgi:hypothetical protein
MPGGGGGRDVHVAAGWSRVDDVEDTGGGVFLYEWEGRAAAAALAWFFRGEEEKTRGGGGGGGGEGARVDALDDVMRVLGVTDEELPVRAMMSLGSGRGGAVLDDALRANLLC